MLLPHQRAHIESQIARHESEIVRLRKLLGEDPRTGSPFPEEEPPVPLSKDEGDKVLKGPR